jgi:RsiW-degrading membrane proteinase PrsW (M82 family)
MTQPPYPPPPPPQEEDILQGGFHGPKTNFFSSIRLQLTSLEKSLWSKSDTGPNLGLLISFILSATLGLLIALGIQIALLQAVGIYVMTILIAPLSEEPAKAVCMLIVMLFMWKLTPNRRWGVALGAAAGLGFGIAESILYIIGIVTSNAPEVSQHAGELVAARIIVTPFMHPLWSAFVGIGVFAFVAKRSTQRSPSGSSSLLPLLFLFIGMINHLVWNSVSVGLSSLGYAAIALNLAIVFPLFAIILRDFLGGHFNFPHFFEPLPEPSLLRPEISPPPPPPPL